MLTALIPKVFYSGLAEGLDLFGGGVGMEILHSEDGFAVLGRDRIKVYLVADAAYAGKDRPSWPSRPTTSRLTSPTPTPPLAVPTSCTPT